MREDGSDLIASGALDVHEIRIRVLNESLQFVSVTLRVRVRVQQVDSESLL